MRLIDADKVVNGIADLMEIEWGYEGIKEDIKRICDDALVHDDDDISRKEHILEIGFIGSRSDVTTFFRTKNKEIWVRCGCFNGNIDDFEKAVEETHGDNKHGRVYKLAIAMAREQIELE